jgi:3-oxoacyl-[acyl-carrier protein] reductase
VKEAQRMGGRNLNGKVAVVTGGSRGIGFQVAKALHGAGAKVAVTGRSAETVEQAAASVGERCRAFVCDQRDPSAIERMAGEVRGALGAPDILVNNAGMWRYAPVAELSLEVWNEVLETNLTGVFLTTKAFLPGMIEKGRGDIYMVSSMSGKKGDAKAAAYSASKFGLQGFSQALLYEVRKQNIRVTVLNPSMVDTEEETADGPLEGPGRFLHAADLAETIVHLACLPGRTLVRDLDIWGTNPP